MATGSPAQPPLARADGIGLRIEIGNGEASVLLRRRDLREDASLREFHGTAVDPAVLSKFLQNWRHLRWRKIPPNLLSSGEVAAEDGDYYVTVVAHGTENVGYEQAIEAFDRFMRSGSAR